MILWDKGNQSAILTGTAYSVRYYGTDDGRQTSFCRLRLNYGYELDQFDNKQQLYFSCIAFGEKADYIQVVTDDAKPTLLVCGRVEAKAYNGKESEQLIIEYVSAQPTIPTATKKKREEERFPDIDF